MPNFKSGFTLVELLLSIAILSVIAGIALPSFQTIIKDTRQVTLYNTVSSTLRFARSEAIKRSAAVTVCPWASETNCGSDWTAGMLVFVDSASDGTILTYDGGDTTLRQVPLANRGVTITANALLNSGSGTAQTTAIRFNGRGQPNWLNGTVLLCDDREESSARAFVMTGSGIGRKAYSSPNSGDVVIDALGNPVTC